VKDVEFKVESLADVIGECADALHEHWDEIALDKDEVKLNPDWDGYKRISDSGNMVIVTARAGKRLVGYSVYFISKSLHYKDILQAESDIFWLDPKCRVGMIGIRLLRFSEKVLKDMGVFRIFSKVKLHKDVGAVFERMGYHPVERVYSKRL